MGNPSPTRADEHGLIWWRRWLRYQAERFPLHQHGPLIAVFSYSAVCFSRLLRTEPGEAFTLPGLFPGMVSFAVCLGFFFQLRVADEFKDYEEDLANRPYRPVQRGLVTRRELLGVGLAVAFLQGLLAALLSPLLLVLLAMSWAYFVLMSREFFVRSWLQNRPLAYMASHMLIMPLIDLFATGCDWLVAGERPNVAGLALFLGSSYFSGVIIEIGRKLRSPEDEESGVNTYSAIWGMPQSTRAWLIAVVIGGALAVAASTQIGFALPVALVAAVLVLIAFQVRSVFLKDPRAGLGKRFELISGIWVLATYLTLGIVPAVIRGIG